MLSKKELFYIDEETIVAKVLWFLAGNHPRGMTQKQITEAIGLDRMSVNSALTAADKGAYCEIGRHFPNGKKRQCYYRLIKMNYPLSETKRNRPVEISTPLFTPDKTLKLINQVFGVAA